MTLTPQEMRKEAGSLDRLCKWCYGHCNATECANDSCHQRAIMLRAGADALEEVERARQRMFPIQDGPSIPWSVIAPFEKQAQRQHCGQTLERLAQRGGLGVGEALSVIEGNGEYYTYWKTGYDKAQLPSYIRRLQAHVDSDLRVRAEKAEAQVATLTERVTALEAERQRFDRLAEGMDKMSDMEAQR